METTTTPLAELIRADRRPGETRVEQAERLGFSESTLRNWENGSCAPRGRGVILRELAAALRRPLAEVLSMTQASRQLTRAARDRAAP